MEYVVSVRYIGRTRTNLPGDMADMRTWLDHMGIAATSFHHVAGGPGLAFRLDFGVAADAVAFAQAFHGRVEGRDPRGAALWDVENNHAHS